MNLCCQREMELGHMPDSREEAQNPPRATQWKDGEPPQEILSSLLLKSPEN